MDTTLLHEAADHGFLARLQLLLALVTLQMGMTVTPTRTEVVLLPVAVPRRSSCGWCRKSSLRVLVRVQSMQKP